MLDIINATAELLRLRWPEIREGLVKVRMLDGMDCHWEPEHVRMWVESRLRGVPGATAEMWLCFDHDSPLPPPQRPLVGFFVTTQAADPFTQVNYRMYVWIAYAHGKGFEEAMEFLINVAQQRGLRGLEATSPRPGMARRLARFGWYPAQVTYRKDFYAHEQDELLQPPRRKRRRAFSYTQPEESRRLH